MPYFICLLCSVLALVVSCVTFILKIVKILVFLSLEKWKFFFSDLPHSSQKILHFDGRRLSQLANFFFVILGMDFDFIGFKK